MQIAVWAKETPHRTRDYISQGCAVLRECGDVHLIIEPPGGEAQAQAELLARCPELDALVIGPWYWPALQPEHWQQARRLKVLAGTFDNRFQWLDFARLSAEGVTIIDTSRSMTPSVAEFALAMTLNLVRDIPAGVELVRKGEWKDHAWDKPGFVFGDLTGRRVGLAGLGSINRRLAELLAPFRCQIRGCDPFVADEDFARFGVERVDSLVELARQSEIFVVGIPPTPKTQAIINREVIDALPKGSLLVLVTRMAVVEQEPLWQRLEADEIRAAIDVFAPEPPPADAWFRRHANVLPTPHIAGGTDYCHRRCFTDACLDTVAVLTGGTPRYQASLWDHRLYQGELTGNLNA